MINNSRDSTDTVQRLPNTILDLIFPDSDLHTITSLLKLTNKYDKSIAQTEQNQLESSVRTSNQHVFILSSTGPHKNEQLVLSSLHTSITNSDAVFIQTKLNDLPISYDNTPRFLKGNLSMLLILIVFNKIRFQLI
jgi:predicted Zn-dependent protease